MSELISIKADITEVLDTLEGFEKERPKIKKALLTTAAQKTRRKIKSGFSEVLHKRSGTLLKSLKYSVKKDGTSATVYPTEKYGFMLASGYTVEPKNQDYLTFKIGDKWIRTYGPINVSAKDWTQPPAQRYLKGAEIEHDLEEKLSKEVTKLEKKYEKKGLDRYEK